MNEKWTVEPGVGIGPFKLGMPEGDVIELSDRWTEESMGEFLVCKTNDVSAWIKDGTLSQIGTHGDARVDGPNGLTLGIPLKELTDAIWVDIYNGVFRFEDQPGLTFDVGGLDLIELVEDNRSAGGLFRLQRDLAVDWIGVDDCLDAFEMVAVELV